jgi:hypothetical protein
VVHDAIAGAADDGDVIVEGVAALAEVLLRERRQHLAGHVVAVEQQHGVGQPRPGLKGTGENRLRPPRRRRVFERRSASVCG